MAKILLADDDIILTEMLKYRLEGTGHQFISATDGQSALRLALSEAPDLVVLDSMMPVMSGPEVLASLKADQTLRRVPVVMLSARKGESDVVAALRAGADEYLTKPFIPQELLIRIDMLLARST